MEEATTSEESTDDDGSNRPLWLLATADDFRSIDFESPISDSNSADCGDLSARYLTKVKPDTNPVTPDGIAAVRAYSMLASVTGMYFKPEERNEPFGPMTVFADGRRSATPSDFRPHVGLLAEVAKRATNLPLKARLSDVCWLLERRQSEMAFAAIAAYTEIVAKADIGELRYPSEMERGVLNPDARDHLLRAIQIGRAVGWDRLETIAAKEWVTRLRDRAIVEQNLVSIYWFCNIDLDFSISDPYEIGNLIKSSLLNAGNDQDSHLVVDLWNLAARAFQRAKSVDDRNHCLNEAAEKLASKAHAHQKSAMLAAHYLSAAIAQLHGVPNKKERRATLRHQLVDVQALIPEEMTVFSQKIDLTDIAESVQDTLKDKDFLGILFLFADIEKSPDQDKIRYEAIKSIQEHPLSSIFSASYLDREGKVIFRSEGGGLNDISDEKIHQKIAQSEEIRRRIVALGKIEPARQIIISKGYLSEDLILSLIIHSLFVPPDLVETFSRGILRFFQGDMTSSAHILFPLLESALRHILRSHGNDVTKFYDTTQTQEERSISSLFEHMRTELQDILTAEIFGDIERIFLKKPGPSLRHAIAHGLISDRDPYGSDAIYGCWLIFRLCMLPLFPHFKEIKDTLRAFY